MTVGYYNEIDETAAAWLRELIRRGHIAYGDVDTRSIQDVRPDDLKGYTQCHFFAGIGVWSYALLRAGWPDDRPVWTGSCPCQPFSAAGKGAGFADERHLWPAFHHLIRVCRPDTVFGEQVASKDGLAWLDLVQADMEGEGYAFGALDTCAAGFGAPHIRQRLYWVADAQQQQGLQERVGLGRISSEPRGADAGQATIGTSVHPGGLANTDGANTSAERQQRGGQLRQQSQNGSALIGLDNSSSSRRNGPQQEPEAHTRNEARLRLLGEGRGESSAAGRPGPTNGQWRDADWLFCRDGKWRPVEPGSFPLADGAPARMGRLRGYGNAINAAQAQGFIEAYLETEHLRLGGL